MNDETLDTYYNKDHPGFRVRTVPDYDADAPHLDWDTYAGNHVLRNAIVTWSPSGLPGSVHAFHNYYGNPDGVSSIELAECIPSDGVVVGFDYTPGYDITVAVSRDPAAWDGYVHVPERSWRLLMGDDPAGWTYTSRERAARSGLAGDFMAISAWIRGEVFGWILERETEWTNAAGGTRTTWEWVNSCHGCYAYDPGDIGDVLADAWIHADAVTEGVAA